jgi:fumarate reductase flavoprotein subunit
MHLVTDCDVVVVGGGGAGLAAAAEAAVLGLNVVLLEKNPELGGSTAWSLGAISANGTELQNRAGIEDHADHHFEDLGLHAGDLAPRDNLLLRRILVDECADAVAWLSRLGIVFMGPAPDPPNRVSRMHNTIPNSRSLIYHLERHCHHLGVKIRLNACCEKILTDANGRVVGMTVQINGQSFQLNARKAVILTTGDYSGAADLKQRWADPKTIHLDSVNPFATGDGHRMADALGAEVVNGDIVRGPILRFIPPKNLHWIQNLPPWRWLALCMAWSIENLPSNWIRPFMMKFMTTALGPSPTLLAEGALLVNEKGELVQMTGKTIGHAVADHDGAQAWFVFDSTIYQRFSAWPYFISTAPGIAYAYMADYEKNRQDLFHCSSDWRELARKAGLNPDGLQAHMSSRYPADEGPFYALGPVKAYVVFTDGGLRVNPSHQVLGPDQVPIPGLYAAGSAGQGGLLLEGHGHHLAWAFVSGRRAAKFAATENRK